MKIEKSGNLTILHLKENTYEKNYFFRFVSLLFYYDCFFLLDIYFAKPEVSKYHWFINSASSIVRDLKFVEESLY